MAIVQGNIADLINRLAEEVFAKFVTRLSTPRSRQATYSVPPSELGRVFGRGELYAVTRAWDEVRESDIKPALPDANAFLGEHLAGAYDFLIRESEHGNDLWDLYCPRIANAIRGHDFQKKIEDVRKDFRGMVNISDVGFSTPEHVVKALAWPLLVESTLLSERLNKDMKRVEREKGCTILSGDHHAFYNPTPYSEAVDAFKKYVECRWPIHVFAIDPVNQSQNVADAFSRRREQQLALAVALASGDIGADSFNRFARQLDYEQQTISLNRTVVGFSHGSDTFGWRIAPRVQSPPVASNSEVRFRELMFGAPSRDRDLKQRQLEPGMRELLAIVIMPSFVPFARMDVRTSWFELTDPNERRFTTEDSVVLGRQIQQVRQLKARCLAEDCFDRPGEGRRLLKAVNQLERRLPIQDMQVQIPYENSLGGFQLFANGSRHLGPELIGFYGEPGIDTENDTELFLVGKNFNVNVTKVIAGGKLVSDQDLLSREILRVKIPKGAKTNAAGEVDIHVATPYGVSSHLHVPVKKGKAATSSLKFSPESMDGCPTCKNCVLTSIALLGEDLKISGAEKNKLAEISVSATLDTGTSRNETLATKKNARGAHETEVKLSIRLRANAKGELELKGKYFIAALRKLLGKVVGCPPGDFAIVVKAKVKSDGQTKAVSVGNELRIQFSGCKPSCTDAGADSATSSLVSASTVSFRPGAPLQVKTSPFAEFQSDGLSALKRSLADQGTASVAFFAYVKNGDRTLKRVSAGPFTVRNGKYLDVKGRLLPMSLDSVMNTEFRDGVNLNGMLARQLNATPKADGISLQAFVKSTTGNVEAVGGSVDVRLERSAFRYEPNEVFHSASAQRGMLVK